MDTADNKRRSARKISGKGSGIDSSDANNSSNDHRCTTATNTTTTSSIGDPERKLHIPIEFFASRIWYNDSTREKARTTSILIPHVPKGKWEPVFPIRVNNLNFGCMITIRGKPTKEDLLSLSNNVDDDYEQNKSSGVIQKRLNLLEVSYEHLYRTLCRTSFYDYKQTQRILHTIEKSTTTTCVRDNNNDGDGCVGVDGTRRVCQNDNDYISKPLHFIKHSCRSNNGSTNRTNSNSSENNLRRSFRNNNSNINDRTMAIIRATDSAVDTVTHNSNCGDVDNDDGIDSGTRLFSKNMHRGWFMLSLGILHLPRTMDVFVEINQWPPDRPDTAKLFNCNGIELRAVGIPWEKMRLLILCQKGKVMGNKDGTKKNEKSNSDVVSSSTLFSINDGGTERSCCYLQALPGDVLNLIIAMVGGYSPVPLSMFNRNKNDNINVARSRFGAVTSATNQQPNTKEDSNKLCRKGKASEAPF